MKVKSHLVEFYHDGLVPKRYHAKILCNLAFTQLKLSQNKETKMSHCAFSFFCKYWHKQMQTNLLR